eukprot:3707448-Rhodomonas_salina.1
MTKSRTKKKKKKRTRKREPGKEGRLNRRLKPSDWERWYSSIAFSLSRATPSPFSVMLARLNTCVQHPISGTLSEHTK